MKQLRGLEEIPLEYSTWGYKKNQLTCMMNLTKVWELYKYKVSSS